MNSTTSLPKVEVKNGVTPPLSLYAFMVWPWDDI
jgi:hypothetical protein